MKPRITLIEWTSMLANFPPGTNRLEGQFYKMDEASMVRQCFDLARETMPNRERRGRPSLSDLLMSVADRKSITNRNWYERDKQAKRILLESSKTSQTSEGF